MALRLVPKHSSVEFPCPGCEFRLHMAHPTLGDWFRSVVRKHFVHAHVAWSFRNEPQQEECVRSGASKLHWPESKHNALSSDGRPMSLALDLFEQTPEGRGRWLVEFYELVWDETKKTAFPIKWGGNWKDDRYDADHFEVVPTQPCDPSTPPKAS